MNTKFNELSHDTQIAIKLRWLADDMGNLEDELTNLIRTSGHPIREERDALDMIYGYGDKFRKALREVSMRLDRGAMILADEIKENE